MNAEQFIKALIELDTDSMSPFEAFTELLRLRREARDVVGGEVVSAEQDREVLMEIVRMCVEALGTHNSVIRDVYFERIKAIARALIVSSQPVCTIDAQDFESEADYDAALAKWESEHSAGSK